MLYWTDKVQKEAEKRKMLRRIDKDELDEILKTRKRTYALWQIVKARAEERGIKVRERRGLTFEPPLRPERDRSNED